MGRPPHKVDSTIIYLDQGMYNIMTEAYCVKCKKKQEMKSEKEVSFNAKGGKKRNAMSGICPACGTKMFRILASKK